MAKRNQKFIISLWGMKLENDMFRSSGSVKDRAISARIEEVAVARAVVCFLSVKNEITQEHVKT